MRHRKLALFGAGLALALTACTGGTTQPAVSSVAVSGPSGSALKIGEAASFTAVARDAGGNALSGKSFTWSSSDENVASVDGSGGVTARRFGTVTITAKAGSVAGSSSSYTTYGLEAVGGTRTTQGSAAVGTSMLSRFRKPDGSGPTGQGTLTLRGPAGWNGSQPLDIPYTGYNGFVWWATRFNIAAVSGTYTLSTTVDGQTYSSSFDIDASQTLTPPSVSTASAATTRVTGAWSAVPGAGHYFFEVWNQTDARRAFDQFVYTANTTATVSGTALDPAKTYYATVNAQTISGLGGPTSPAFTGPLPRQWNSAWARGPNLTF